MRSLRVLVGCLLVFVGLFGGWLGCVWGFRLFLVACFAGSRILLMHRPTSPDWPVGPLHVLIAACARPPSSYPCALGACLVGFLLVGFCLFGLGVCGCLVGFLVFRHTPTAPLRSAPFLFSLLETDCTRLSQAVCCAFLWRPSFGIAISESQRMAVSLCLRGCQRL